VDKLALSTAKTNKIMKSVEGIWHCPNFLGDSFELTSCDDGALMLQMVCNFAKSFRTRGASIRLEPCTKGLWEADSQVRLWHNGKALFLQHCKNRKWGSEVQAFRDSHAATRSFFRDTFWKSNHQQEAAKESKVFDQLLIERESSTLFKVMAEPVDMESMFVKKDSDVVSAFNPTPSHTARGHTCEICMTREANIVLMPCAHSGLCERCLHEMMVRDNRASCPFCRQTIEKVAKIESTVSWMVLTGADVKPVSELKVTAMSR